MKSPGEWREIFEEGSRPSENVAGEPMNAVERAEFREMVRKIEGPWYDEIPDHAITDIQEDAIASERERTREMLITRADRAREDEDESGEFALRQMLESLPPLVSRSQTTEGTEAVEKLLRETERGRTGRMGTEPPIPPDARPPADERPPDSTS